MILCPDHIATGRMTSMFDRDISEHSRHITGMLKNARICVIGGAGSIGASMTRLLATFPLDRLTIIDHNENALANLMRSFRASSSPILAQKIETLPLDFGSELFASFLGSQAPYHFVFNFAALKHVRTERDVFSALALIETNVLKPAHLLQTLGEFMPNTSYFSVSTDKAANPVSFMGATKRLMEHVMFCSSSISKHEASRTAARFANVAYSEGSLLASFEQRMRDRVPLAAPTGILRYFISHTEAAELCLLSALLGDTEHIYFPKLDPMENMVALEEVARKFLHANGYEADIFTMDEEDDAKAALEGPAADRKWPLILTPADTAGEKPYEEFVGENEHAGLTPMHELYAIRYQSELSTREVDASLAEFEAMVRGNSDSELTLDGLKARIANLIPAFSETHIASEKRLDDRI